MKDIFVDNMVYILNNLKFREVKTDQDVIQCYNDCRKKAIEIENNYKKPPDKTRGLENNL